MEIKHWKTGSVIYNGEGEDLREVLKQAVLGGAYLGGAYLGCAYLGGAYLGCAYLHGAYLRGAYLGGAYLRGAYLGGADLRGADLRGADLRGADLRGADLRGAYLRGAYLGGAYLGGADLGDADLRGADLRGADLGVPAVIIASGNWGEVSDELCADLMLWDAANHPDPALFDKWAATPDGPCPYASMKVQRACYFKEKRSLWGRGQVCRPYDLMVRLLAEKCPEWTDEKRAAFEAKFKKEA